MSVRKDVSAVLELCGNLKTKASKELFISSYGPPNDNVTVMLHTGVLATKFFVLTKNTSKATEQDPTCLVKYMEGVNDITACISTRLCRRRKG